MKLIQTAIIFDQGEIAQTTGWHAIYDAYADTIPKMVNPPNNELLCDQEEDSEVEQGRKENGSMA